MIKFPYGISDFDELIRDNYVYIDRTDRIPLIEESGKYLFFLRPRRFGKSLLLSMLENYYDIAQSDRFEFLFGNLAIGQNPTPLCNHYMVMRWDFSRIGISRSQNDMRDSMFNHINSRVQRFALKYASYLKADIQLHPTDALISFDQMLSVVQHSGFELYLFIDEYDNFANEVMMARGNQSQEEYTALISGEGLLKTVFKNIKSAGSGDGLGRLFATGVSPIVLSDTTSGFNVSIDTSLREDFNDICGFQQDEVKPLLEQVIHTCQLPSAQVNEALDLMKLFYNGSRFTVGEAYCVYSPTLTFYFLDILQRTCAYPAEMLDKNLSTDYNKLVYISNHIGGEELLENAIDESKTVSVNAIRQDFTLGEILSQTKRRDRMASLLYHLGILTLNGRTVYGQLKLEIPNLVMRRLYVDRLLEMTLPNDADQDVAQYAAEQLFRHGQIQPICDFVEERYFQIFDNRDYLSANELTIKTAFLTLLYNDTLYVMDSEAALERTYADLIMMIRPEVRGYALFDILLEFKFVKVSDTGLTGEAIRKKDKASLSKLASVKEQLDAAQIQLKRYQKALENKYGSALRLRIYAIVSIGFDRLVWKEVDGNEYREIDE
ncbi:MAG: AAA family ATPase [Chloroflexota bacterium]